MLVHFIGSKSGIKEELPYYNAIIQCIVDGGNRVSRNWVKELHSLGNDKLKNDYQTWAQVDDENSRALAGSDVVIMEGTVKSFFAGFQAAQAIAQKKPILILTRENIPVSIAGLNTPSGFIRSVTYNLASIRLIIDGFLNDNTITTKDLRFNFYLDRSTYRFLQWTSEVTGMTKSEIIRTTLRNEMRKTNP